MHTNKFLDSYMIIFFAFFLTGCGGGGGDPVVDPQKDGKFVGENGVFSDTYYNNSIDFMMTVPEGWSVDNQGNIRDDIGNVEGRISGESRRNSNPIEDVNLYQRDVENSSFSYEEHYRFWKEIENRNYCIVKAEVSVNSSSKMIIIIFHGYFKSALVSRVVFKVPSNIWNDTLSKVISETVDTIVPQSSTIGDIRRVLNQFKYAYESKDLPFYFSLMSDAFFIEAYNSSRSQIMGNVELQNAINKEIFEDKNWTLEFKDLREYYNTGEYHAVTIDLKISLYRGGGLIGGGNWGIDRTTFIREKGYLRLAGEATPGVGEIWGKNIGINQGNNPPTAKFQYLWNEAEKRVYVDASGSYDLEDTSSLLKVRWDWTSDGTYDTNWTNLKNSSHAYAASGTYQITLQVKDLRGATAKTTLQVVVKGGGVIGKKWGEPRKIIFNTAEGGTDYASISPDGRKILFSRFLKNEDYDIYSTDIDGRNEIRLTNTSLGERWPAWSPDGKKIVYIKSFYSSRGDLWEMDANGSNQVLKWDINEASSPSYLGDLNFPEIIFGLIGQNNREEIHMTHGWPNVRASSLRMDFGSFPKCSPVDDDLAIFSHSSGVYIFQPRQLSNTKLLIGKVFSYPSWSNDGKEIVMSGGSIEGFGIWIANSDGSGLTWITQEPGMKPSMHGDKIVYTALGGEGGIYLIERN